MGHLNFELEQKVKDFFFSGLESQWGVLHK